MRKRMLEGLLNLSLLPSPSMEERILLAELQRSFRELPFLETVDAVPSAAAWLSNTNRLRELVLNQDPRKFLRWDVITRTMFVVFERYISKELDFLRHRPDWNTRWRTAIRESPAGHPIPYIFYPASSSNLIHHAYHLAQFEEMTSAQVHQMDYVFEFGGGYGSMCRLFYNLGFRGRYIIFDLPSFSALQMYFLKSVGLPVLLVTEFIRSRTGVACVSDIRQLTGLLTDHMEAKNTMFVATSSISEAPTRVRDSVLPLAAELQSFLITYQDTFGEVNNVDFFDKWKQSLRNVAWHGWRIEHSPGNNYLVGRVSSNS